MVITLLWIHICFPSIFWVAARYGRKGFFFLSLFIRWELIHQVRKNLSIFSEYLKRVEIGIQPSCPEQLKDWRLSFYPWRNALWFVISFHQRQQRDLPNVLRYGIPYPGSKTPDHSFPYHISKTKGIFYLQPRRWSVRFIGKEVGLCNSEPKSNNNNNKSNKLNLKFLGVT